MRLPHPPLRKHQTLEMDRGGAIITHPGHKHHLGQKPKLGGRYADNHTHLHIIFCPSIIYPCFAFLFYCCFQKQKKTKNISGVSLWLSLWFFVFGFLNLLVSLLFENPK